MKTTAAELGKTDGARYASVAKRNGHNTIERLDLIQLSHGAWETSGLHRSYASRSEYATAFRAAYTGALA